MTHGYGAVKVRKLLDFPLRLGEGPCWSAAEQALYFVDILRPALFRLDVVTGALREWPMPREIGSFGLAPDGRMVVALRDGVYWFAPATGALTLLARPEPDRPTNRLNDGKIGPDGRFWVGSMDDRPDKQPVGALYRIGVDGTCLRISDGFTVSNGLAWTPDGRTMFHSDSRGPWVHAYDFDARAGTATNRRHLITLSETDGRPDGAACDAEGFYWSAGVSAGCLNRISPQGEIVAKISLPVLAPTMPCFGGPDLKTLYVTSLATERSGVHEDGGLYALDSEVPGAPIARFGEPL